MSKCKILVDCLSDYVGQNIYSVLGQNNGRRPRTIAEFRVVANTTIALCGQTLNKSRSNRSKQGLQAATDRLYEPENF